MAGQEKKHRVLIVDDSELNRSILSDILGQEYEVLEAPNGLEAVGVIQRYEHDLSLVLLDIVMPVMDGFEVLATMNRAGWTAEIPVIMISAETSSAHVDHAYDLGATDYISRPFESKVVRRRVKNTIMLYAKQKMLRSMVTEQVYEKERNSNLMVEILSNIVEFRNGESGLHVLHIRVITEMLLNSLMRHTDQYPLSHAKIMMISNASALHDIGKIAISGEILNKPGRLTKEEFEVIKTHSQIGAEMLKNIPHRQEEELVQVAYEICRWHHERYDGRGYPDGLSGDEIPIAAQAVSLADVYDALTSERVYKAAYSHEKAMEMILGGECGVFNPILLESLTDISAGIGRELKIRSLSGSTAKEMQDITNKLIADGDLAASDRTLRLLEQERIKYQFFASMSREVQFEYNAMANILTFSEWGARHLGVSELVMDPMNNTQLQRIFQQEDTLSAVLAMRKATPQDPVVSLILPLCIQGRQRWCRLLARAMWEDEEHPVLIGCIGKITDIHEEYERMGGLEKMAVRDQLTGLYHHANARSLIEKQLAAFPEGGFLMILLDLDHFKCANDQHGHLFGDDVLRHVAKRISASIRADDIAARIGGDEFLIFLGCPNLSSERIERLFQSLTDEYGQYPISLSMGIARFPEGGGDYETLFRHADEALYAAKREGRNRYRFHEAPCGAAAAQG